MPIAIPGSGRLGHNQGEPHAGTLVTQRLDNHGFRQSGKTERKLHLTVQLHGLG